MTQRSNKHAKIGPSKKSTCIKKNDHEEQFIFIDATFGAGGYTTEILKMYPNSKVIGIDTDYYSNPIIQQHEKLIHDKFGKDRLEVYGVNFRNLKQLVTETILPKLDVKQKPIGSHVIDGIVFDLGVSSMQLDYGHRGFSFLRDGPLDMRMNPSDENCPTAREVLNNMSELDLRMIIAKFGEEENASKIAKSIVHYRNNVKPFDTTLELANLIESITPFKDRKKKKIHPATKTFQAIRIYVNDELGALATALDATRDVLKLGTGRLVVVSYHSLEDRIAKEFIKENNTYFKKVTKKLVTPDEEEIETNVRSRSAKLRCAQRTDVVDSNI
ncbi:hypothetical protein C9374_001359 [Naegleria lovaniensis]|uniref:Uncharacterized protein n=1 Tax=Naegleria lovaniensis TaxID=51637 RepID=A0AA88GVM8_NAELO|nr:uncharacterized protein C9374_001359 [Naegleria lovaniensis]KAG2387765.1 hypothetical protein C9374_001359 [Naegleria lovaniensis]